MEKENTRAWACQFIQIIGTSKPTDQKEILELISMQKEYTASSLIASKTNFKLTLI